MLRNVLLCASLAVAITMAAGCKKEEKKVDLDSVVGTYKGTQTITYKATSPTKERTTTKEVSVVVKKNDVVKGLLGDFTIDNVPAKIESNKDGKLTLKVKFGVASGEVVMTGSELTYKIDYSIHTEEFKGKKQ